MSTSDTDLRIAPVAADFEPRIDDDALKVLRRLNQFGYHGFLVGGGVRDLLLDRSPKDFDVATSARPVEVRKLFRNCRLIGRRFRLAHVLFNAGKIVEVATFRAKPGSDGDAEDADDGDAELITDDNEFGSPESDAYRRDFTVNALFYDPVEGAVLDYVGGLEDLDRRLLRTIGDPVVRFREDPIRVLRAVKFAARLDFGFETECRAAIDSERFELEKAAVPRLLQEISRMLSGGASRRSFELLAELGIVEFLVPEVAAYLGRPSDDAFAPLGALLDALDATVGTGTEVDEGVALACIYWPIYRALLTSLPHPPHASHLRGLAEMLVGPMGVRLRMPRRNIATVLAILEGHVRFEAATRRRATRAGFARQPHFGDLLAFLNLRAQAEGLPPEVVEAWHELAREFPPRHGRSRDDDFDFDRGDDRPRRGNSNGRRRRRV